MNCSNKKEIIKLLGNSNLWKKKDISLLLGDVDTFSEKEFNNKISELIKYLISQKKLPPLIKIFIYSLQKENFLATKNIGKINKNVIKSLYLFLQCLKEYINKNYHNDEIALILKEEDYKELNEALKFWDSQAREI